MIAEEFKRVLLVHKGIIIFFVMCILVVLDFLRYNGSSIGNEQFETYGKCYAKYSGKLTEEKLECIKSECDKREGQFDDEGNAYRSLYEDAKKAWSVMDEPYIVYYKGWSSILDNGVADRVLRLFLMIIAVIVFAYDSGHKVQNIFSTSVNGRRRLVMTRVLVYTLIALFFIIVQGAIEYIIAKNTLSLTLYCPEAPIQSVMVFRNCELNLTLFGGFVFYLVCEFIGVMIGGLFVCLIASLARNMYVSIVAGVIIFFEGYFFSGLYEFPYFIPQRLFMAYDLLVELDSLKVMFVSMGVMFLLLGLVAAINHEYGKRRLV